MIKKVFNKYRELILYVFFGGCTTLVNWLSYYLFAHIINLNTATSTSLAWFCGVLFAYITNRKWVFNSKAKTKKEIIKEIISFFACRLLTGLVDVFIMWLFVDKFGFNDMIIKLVSNIVVIILNYVASKLIIFSNKGLFKDKEKRKEFIKGFFILLFFTLLSYIVLLASPLHPWIKSATEVDGAGFQKMAFIMMKGYIPYKDSFDHKGPLIYLINYIGMSIKYYYGVFYMEWISLITALALIYKIARLKCKKALSLFITFVSSLTFIYYFDTGNYTEEFAIPFILLGIYIFVDYLLNNKINKFRLIVNGASLGAVLMLRPNMIALWIVFCVAVVVKCIKEKSFKELLKYVLYFLIGAFIVILPFIIWLGINGALKDFAYDYLVFNFIYSKISEDGIGFPDKIKAFLLYGVHILNLMSIVMTIYLIIKEKKKCVYVTYLIFIIINLVSLSLSGNLYNHYGLVMVPIFAFPMSQMFESGMGKKTIRFIMGVSIIAVCFVLTLHQYYHIVFVQIKKYDSIDNDYLGFKTMQTIIEKSTDKNDRIGVYGNYDIAYVLSKRLPATYYAYQFPLGKINEKVFDDYFQELKETNPKIIVFELKRKDKSIVEFLKDNNYIEIYNNSRIAIYKKKDILNE